jgi:hypothetical protein
MKSGLILLFILMLVASCTTQDICDNDSQSILVARFRTLVDNQIRDTLISGFSIHGIREGWVDRPLYDSVSTGKITIPLDPNHDLSRFVLSAGDKKDTLVIFHSSEAYLISYNCGFAARFTLEEFSYGGALIRDLELIKAEVDAELETNEEHIWIYF